MPRPEPLAGRWWLLPPVAFLKQRKLRELQEWSVAVFWALLVVMLLVSLGYTAYRMRRSAFLTTLDQSHP